jgi:CheY-like chemotaxis protein
VAIEHHVLSVATNAAPAAPAVGDWVTLDPHASEGHITAILSRAIALSADSAGSIEEQLLATNVDLALVIDRAIDPNPRRVERELLSADGATRSAVVFTKPDLVSDVAAIWNSLEPVAGGRALIPVSGVTGEGLDRLRAEFTEGVTLACFGASGVGKSTLINALLGEQRMAKVLIVDDSDAECRMLAALVQAEHEVIVRSYGIDVVWPYKRSRPNAVLLDINMPIMSGLEALQKIRLFDANARIAILSGERDQDSIIAAIAAGAVDFVAKPYTSERVNAALEALLTDEPVEAPSDDSGAAG